MPITSSTVLTTEFGDFKVCYHENLGEFCVSISAGDLEKPGSIVRLHSSCLFSEALHSVDCDCNLQLSKAMELIGKEGQGVVIYLYQEGRGHGLANKIKSMEIERTKGVDTVQAFTELHFDLDPRRYDIALAALKDLNLNQEIRLISNNPRKRKQLEDGGYIVSTRIEMKYPVNDHVKKYLKVKKDKLGHQIIEELIK